MRLSKIKMSGFKSFVDPTSLELPGDMVGIVGPNGCGKSNIIDAVRFVMGETSKHIRGDSAEDIIFNGSSGRSPVGQASIELVFDNSSKKLGGQYASYDEIAIRRQVTRDGLSKYFLNGTRCRRRDIVDIFLGTGLGPRSYAIIEQGMISRLIDAKPDELRVYLEEAAGISKYKERRRETENRIRHTRENLDRLHDLIEEVDSQITRLKRQAAAAEKFKELKAEERRVQAELLLLRLRFIESEQGQQSQRVEELRTQLEKCIAELRSTEAEIEKLRVAHSEANESLNQVQGRFYQVGADLSRLEQSLQHARESKQRLQGEVDQLQQALQENERELHNHQNEINTHQKNVVVLEPELEALDHEIKAAQASLDDIEQSVANAQEAWDQLMREMNDPSQTIQTQSSRLHFIDQEISRLTARQTKLEAEHAQLNGQEHGFEIERLAGQAQISQQALQECEEQVSRQAVAIQDSRSQLNELNQSMDHLKSARQRQLGELASLEALQNAALHRDDQQLQDWIAHQQLASSTRLADEIDVESGWESAVEAVLGDYLEALCVDELDVLTQRLQDLPEGRVILMQASMHEAMIAQPNTLASKVKTRLPVMAQLDTVLLAQDLPAAIHMRTRLQPGQSVITREGFWLGPHWVRFSKSLHAESSVLRRKTKITDLQRQLSDLDAEIQALEAEQGHAREQLTMAEQAREQAQAQRNQTFRSCAEAQAELTRKKAAQEHWQQRQEQITAYLEETRAHLQDYEAQLVVAKEQQQSALLTLSSLEDQKQALQDRRNNALEQLNASKQTLAQLRDRRHSSQVRLETSRAHMSSAQQLTQRIEQQNRELATRLQASQDKLLASESPIQELAAELNSHLSVRSSVEAELVDARKKLESIEGRIQGCEERRQRADLAITEQRERLDEGRMKWQELNVRAQTMQEELAEYPWSKDEITAELTEGATATEWQERVEELGRKISRLGSINLAAIEEYEEQTERKEYLDRQNEDLTTALQTLEDAIRKIDKETKDRFKDTFDTVNNHLQAMYPRLFPNGKAYLEMTGDDLLTTGVSIMARPPGKRVSSIHLLSGGEKALTAVALVLSIFELNPAPFCLLDEVDAPLDDANVGRFCELIKDMSEAVQFIFITHNKTTMEYASHLLGVTMNEPGVSRLVSVDVEEAEELATSA